MIKTIRGLDYERENQHILIVGTVENTSDLPGSTTRVVVNVQVSIDMVFRPKTKKKKTKKNYAFEMLIRVKCIERCARIISNFKTINIRGMNLCSTFNGLIGR